MAGNPNWGKAPKPSKPTLTAFERLVRKLHLKPNEYLTSRSLRRWAVKHRNNRYVPECLLEAWALETQVSEMHTAY